MVHSQFVLLDHQIREPLKQRWSFLTNAADVPSNYRSKLILFSFLEFILSMNPKHFSNTAEAFKIIDEIIVPYLMNELHLPQDHPSLLIMDVFRGQMTEKVLEKLKCNKIFLVRVPANMTHIFQLLDLTVNGHFEQYMKEKFST